MKLNKLFAIFAMVAAVAFAACNTVPEVPDGPGPNGQDTTSVNPPAGEDVDWSDANLPEGAITCAKAREIAAALESGVVTSETYYVYGIVKKFGSKHADGIAQYGNATFYMVDKQGDSDDFEAYQVYNLNKQKYTSEEQIAVGDRVIVCCHITNYNGTYETAGKGDGYVYWSSNPKAGEAGGTTGGGEENPNPDVTNDGSEAHPFTAADVIALNNTKTGNYYVKAYIVGQVKAGATSAANNCELAAPFTANDNGANSNMLVAAAATGATESNVVFVQLPTGAVRDGLNVVQNEGNLGKEVLLYGSLEKYFGGVGVKSVSYAVIDGQELGVKPGATFSEPEATVATVAEFNAAAVSDQVYFELTGTIGGTINTTYGNFDLTDATGTVYVYGLTASYIPMSNGKATNDKSYATLNLKEGDNVTIRGTRGEYNDKIEVMGAYFVRKN